MKKIRLALLFLVANPALAVDVELAKCRQIEEIAARVTCYDNIVDADKTDTAVDLNDGAVTTTSDRPTNAVPDAQMLFGTNDADAKRIVEATLSIEQIDQIEAVVTDARLSASKKLTVVLDNGQIWRQLDNRRLRLESGETVVVREASLGSFQMEKGSGSRSIRVKRVK